MNLILASSSKYRGELLSRLGIPFTMAKPEVDEEKIKAQLLHKHVPPREIAEILSKAKGDSVYRHNMKATIISGDQLVEFQGQILGKPGTKEKAIQQLTEMQGHAHELITSTTLIINSHTFQHNNHALMRMKNLTTGEIRRYVELDQPLDCAGSIKIEQHGISLFEKIECEDFSAIQGLPLIWLSNTLKRNGYELFKK